MSKSRRSSSPSTKASAASSVESRRVEDEGSPNADKTRPAATLVTPAAATASNKRAASNHETPQPSARRKLHFDANDVPHVTPHRVQDPVPPSPAKRRLLFGRYVTETQVQPNVKTVYGIVRKLTGSLGGNAYCGPIYGELTMGSMQKMVDLMKEHTGLSAESRFVDVGSGIGKPNLHVAQDPGVAWSYGIEVERDRWILGYACLKAVLDAARTDPTVGYRCVLDCHDIQDAQSFDPFTHVYMFSIGFPPTLWLHLAEMWNRSSSGYLICFHSPKTIVEDYGFEVELITQAPTSMHGSKEGHTGYLYRRLSPAAPSKPSTTLRCDPLFQPAWDLARGSLEHLHEVVSERLDEEMNQSARGRRMRPRSKRTG